MPWYDGETLLEHLEQLNPSQVEEVGARFPVQTVIRPKQDQYHDFRGYAGKVSGGALAVGDAVTVLPSGRSSVIKDILFYNASFIKVDAGNSCTITLEDDVNVSRGDILVKSAQAPSLTKELQATVCWMDNNALVPGTKYLVQQGTAQILGKVKSINSIVHTDFSGVDATDKLVLNDIGKVTIQLSKQVLNDQFLDNKQTGSFILIDTQSHATAGVGFIGS
jgi:sulfate adenylyltransferase subunit 1